MNNRPPRRQKPWMQEAARESRELAKNYLIKYLENLNDYIFTAAEVSHNRVVELANETLLKANFDLQKEIELHASLKDRTTRGYHHFDNKKTSLDAKEKTEVEEARGYPGHFNNKRTSLDDGDDDFGWGYGGAKKKKRYNPYDDKEEYEPDHYHNPEILDQEKEPLKKESNDDDKEEEDRDLDTDKVLKDAIFCEDQYIEDPERRALVIGNAELTDRLMEAIKVVLLQEILDAFIFHGKGRKGFPSREEFMKIYDSNWALHKVLMNRSPDYRIAPKLQTMIKTLSKKIRTKILEKIYAIAQVTFEANDRIVKKSKNPTFSGAVKMPYKADAHTMKQEGTVLPFMKKNDDDDDTEEDNNADNFLGNPEGYRKKSLRLLSNLEAEMALSKKDRLALKYAFSLAGIEKNGKEKDLLSQQTIMALLNVLPVGELTYNAYMSVENIVEAYYKDFDPEEWNKSGEDIDERAKRLGKRLLLKIGK
jgi:hypothetical protein